jgi:hypothetical protein
MPDIREADWKRFRQVREQALERFCRRVLDEAVRVAAGNCEDGPSQHERYLKLYRLMRARDKELAQTFNGSSRSNAFFQLVSMRRQGLVSDEEFASFSPEMQERVESLLDFAKKLG